MSKKIEKSEAEWRAELGPQEFEVTRCSATEPAFTGRYWNSKEDGTYVCICCGEPLFRSGDKFDSGTGWPSFTKPVEDASIDEHQDQAYGMIRTEVRCSKCDAHLGHVFPDGPRPTGARYCINSASLDLKKK